MKTFDEITSLSLIDKILSIEKNTKKGCVPLYNDVYKDSVRNANKIKHHAAFGKYPELLFAERAPNQTDKEASYLKANYKCNTNSVFIDYLSTVNRMWNDGNWNISWSEKAKEDGQKKYLEEELYIYVSIDNFFKNVLPQIKASDAMAVLAVKPYSIPTTTNEQGEVVIDGSVRCEPLPYIYESKNILLFDNENYCLVETNDKSEVVFANKVVKEGRIFELYDNENIWRIEQYGEKTKNLFRAYIYWEHNLGYLPCERLKGVPILDDGNLIYQSPFLFVTDLLDDALLDFNQIRLSKSAVVFPQRYMYGDACDYSENEINCIDGHLKYNDGGDRICPQCNGTGVKSRLSPLGVLIVKGGDKFNEGDTALKGSPIGYVEPSTNALEFLTKSIERSIAEARQMLHLNNSNKNSTSNPTNTTAVHTSTELKAMYSFIQQVANETFDLYHFAIKCIGEMRYGKEFEMPQIRYPKSFDLRTDEDYTREITEAIANNMPSFVIYSLVYSYIQNRFSVQKDALNIYNLIMLADRLVTLNSNQLAIAKDVASWERILHESSMTFLNELIVKDDKFLEKPIEEQVILLQQVAKDKAKEIEPQTITIDNLA
jgi:hypothetical protein